MTKVELFLAKAADCERAAHASRDESVKAQYQQLARWWRELAQLAEDKSTKTMNSSRDGSSPDK